MITFEVVSGDNGEVDEQVEGEPNMSELEQSDSEGSFRNFGSAGQQVQPTSLLWRLCMDGHRVSRHVQSVIRLSATVVADEICMDTV